MDNVYVCKDGRMRIYLKDTKKVVSYPKYLMEQHIGRPLERGEEVHHKDLDPLNNDISNLEIRIHGEHQREHSTKYVDQLKICPWCGKEFVWSALRQQRATGNKHEAGPFCSRVCVGYYGQSVQAAKKGSVV